MKFGLYWWQWGIVFGLSVVASLPTLLFDPAMGAGQLFVTVGVLYIVVRTVVGFVRGFRGGSGSENADSA